MKRYGQVVSVEERALDQWTQRALKSQYDQALEEPLPEELLALIRDFPEQH